MHLNYGVFIIKVLVVFGIAVTAFILKLRPLKLLIVKYGRPAAWGRKIG